MRKLGLRCALTLCFVMLGLVPAHASVLDLTSGETHYSLTGYLEALEDPDGQLSLADVRRPDNAVRFKPLSGDVAVIGVTRSVYWVRFTVRGPQVSPERWWVELALPSLDDIEFYYPVGQAYAVLHAGDLRPFESRPYKHRNYVFPISPGGTAGGTAPVTFYLRLKSQNSITLPMAVWQEPALAAHTEKTTMVFLMSYGIMAAMALYNFFLFLSLKDRSYLYYTLNALATTSLLVWSNGIGFQYLWPESPWFQNVGSPLAIGFSLVTAVMFNRSFLNTRCFAPRIDWLLRASIYPVLVYTTWRLIEPSFVIDRVGSALALLITLAMPTAAIVCWRKGYRPARFYVLAYAMLGAALVLYQLNVYRIWTHGFPLEYLIQAGFVLESILLSLALADRINMLRREKDAAQQAAYLALQESERVLEEKVAQRTEELSAVNRELGFTVQQLSRLNQEKNEFLNIVAHDLNAPLTGVLLTAKGAEANYERLNQNQIKTILADIRSSVSNASSIVSRLLSLGKAEAGAAVLESQPVNVNHVLAAAANDFSKIAHRKRIRLEVRHENDAVVRGDGSALFEVIQNLISNALKFSAPDTTVTLRVLQRDGLVRLECQDQGPGLTDEDKIMLFEKYVRRSARPTGGEQSSGLGLSIVKKLIESMGGSVGCESTHGAGACFYIELPSAAVARVTPQAMGD